MRRWCPPLYAALSDLRTEVEKAGEAFDEALGHPDPQKEGGAVYRPVPLQIRQRYRRALIERSRVLAVIAAAQALSSS